MGLSRAIHRAVQVAAKKTALVFGARRWTWGEVGTRVAKAAGALSTLGVGDNDRVAVLALNSDRFVELFLAVPWAGGVIVPLNWRWCEQELGDALDDAEPKVLAVDDRMLEMGLALSKGRPWLKVIHIGDEAAAGLPRYEDLLEHASPLADTERHGDDLYSIFYTGGTTGRSKGVMLSHRNILMGAATAHREGYFREDSICLIVPSFFHVAGSWPVISITESAATMIVLPVFDAGAMLEAIALHRAEEAVVVPTMIQALIDHPTMSTTDTSSFRTLVFGGSPITTALLDRACAALPHTQFIQLYGMTELSPKLTGLHHKYLFGAYRELGRHRSVGRVCYGMETRIVDDQGRDIGTGAVGEIVARGDNVMLGYWRRPQETEAALRSGWLHTGDAGYIDEEGFLYIVDRVKDMIISGGENVYSVEVENVVTLHPAVRECVVIGIPHEKWVEQVHAIVILKDGAMVAEEELIAFSREHLAGYKIPRSITFRSEPFPLSPANKILKRELRAPYWAGRSSSIS